MNKSILLWEKDRLVFQLLPDNRQDVKVKFFYGDNVKDVKKIMVEREVAFAFENNIMYMFFKLPGGKVKEICRRYCE